MGALNKRIIRGIGQKGTADYLICFSTVMKDYSNKNKYVALKAANITLKSLVEKYARIIETYTDGYCLLSGSCKVL